MRIVIQTDADFTSPGKRSARMVSLDRGARRIRWYVAGHIFRTLAVTPQNVRLTQAWIDNR